jgi:hypothetical protein
MDLKEISESKVSAKCKWPGRRLRIGGVAINLDDLRARYVMMIYEPDTLQRDPTVLKDIVQRFGGTLALNAAVGTGGLIEVNQKVELV